MEKAWTTTDLGALAAVKRVELKETLGLSGCEISLNRLEPGAAIPFVHRHRDNEEAYVILSGKGEFWLDGEIIPLVEGSCVRVEPSVGRAIRASKDSALTYACVQAAAGSLKGYTRTDGVILDEKTGW